MNKKLRVAFMGTPDFVLPTIQSLIDGPHELLCIYTQPPRPQGRKKELVNTPAHNLANAQNIEVRHPNNFKSGKDIKDFEDLELDVAIVAAYGMLLPQIILDAPKFGCINIHPSLLPRWRGPSPIQYAIWKGDDETGVTVMELEKAMDTGPIIAQEKCLITPETNFISLNHDLWAKGTVLLNQALDDIATTNQLHSTPQREEGVSYCKMLTKESGRIDWTQNAPEIDCQIRGLNPWPGTWCFDSDGKRTKILEARFEADDHKSLPDNAGIAWSAGKILSNGQVVCGDDTILKLIKIQPENKKPMSVKDAENGGYLTQGDFLS